MNSADDVARTIRDLNACWLDGRVDELHRYFHPDVVMAPPPPARRRVGRDAMIQSFRDYLAAARTHAFEETGIDVDVFGGVAVATLHFRVRYELDGTVHDERGVDVSVLVPHDGAWVVAWRTLVPGQSTTG
ncbi:MAG: nuclear transport factor 2 family protein [Acidobacteriota bacterium]